MKSLFKTALLGLAVWISVAVSASVRSRAEVLLLLETRATATGFRTSMHAPLDERVGVVWAFSPLPPFHVARVDVQGPGCRFTKDFVFLSWAGERTVLWEDGG